MQKFESENENAHSLAFVFAFAFTFHQQAHSRSHSHLCPYSSTAHSHSQSLTCAHTNNTIAFECRRDCLTEWVHSFRVCKYRFLCMLHVVCMFVPVCACMWVSEFVCACDAYVLLHMETHACVRLCSRKSLLQYYPVACSKHICHTESM